MDKIIKFMFEHRQRAALMFARYITILVCSLLVLGIVVFALGRYGYWK
jgi:hypothetical protein